MKERAHRKERVGVVVSDKMNKTVVVKVGRKKPHPQYQKIVVYNKKYYAHCENPDVKVGTTVKIMETRPLSKLKRWRVTEVLA
ncbi:MAG: 30S ribosomal protein S17 [Candidatus Algichlamydia australiensis]|nr:30S ribosomal protein S17 [Chlamydiales bacterium]